MNILLSILLAASAIDPETTDIPKSFLDHILNGLDSGFFWACVVAAYFTYAMRMWWMVDYAAKNNPQTPRGFSREYFWNNNTKAILRDFFTIPVVILLYPQLLDLFLTWGQNADFIPEWLGKLFDRYSTVTVFTSAIIGAVYKNIEAWLRKRKWKKKTSKKGLDA